jgi:hypothetical protein
MTFAIHAWKDAQSVVTIRISPDAAVDKARLLEGSGWRVHITDLAGRQFSVSDFDRLLLPIERLLTIPHEDVNLIRLTGVLKSR